MGRVDGKVAIVTGGSLGIGAAAVELLAAEGAKVAIVDVKDKEGRDLAARLDGGKGMVRYWHMDVSSEAEVKNVFGEVAKAFGGLHILVNNAGIAGVSKPTHELTEAEWDRVQTVNVKGVFFCTKHAIAHLRSSGGGSIINLSSIYGLIGAPDVPPYHASKGAVRLMSKVDAMLYARDGIRVNSVHPGYVWTPMVEGHLAAMSDPAAARVQLESLHPLGHIGVPMDIAYGILYLACKESAFVTGSELVIDGGYTAR